MGRWVFFSLDFWALQRDVPPGPEMWGWPVASLPVNPMAQTGLIRSEVACLRGSPCVEVVLDVGRGSRARSPAAIHEADVVNKAGEVHSTGTFLAWKTSTRILYCCTPAPSTSTAGSLQVLAGKLGYRLRPRHLGW